MGMTMTQKILAAHAGLDKVEPGQLIMAKLDMVLGNDITSPVAINEFEKAGTGFSFSNYNAHEMENTVWRAIAGFSDKDGWDILRKRAMNCDNSWGNSANAYIKLYKEIAGE